MIAPELFVPPPDVQRKIAHRAARTAARVRIIERRRRRYLVLRRVGAMMALLTLVVVAYLGRMANVTRLNYELARSVRLETRLVDDSARLDDRIAGLESRERLAAIGAKLGMHDAQTFASVVVPRAERAAEPRGVALLGWLK
jgi:hypothetical protein